MMMFIKTVIIFICSKKYIIGAGVTRNALVFSSINGASQKTALFLNGNITPLNSYNTSFKNILLSNTHVDGIVLMSHLPAQ